MEFVLDGRKLMLEAKAKVKKEKEVKREGKKKKKKKNKVIIKLFEGESVLSKNVIKVNGVCICHHCNEDLFDGKQFSVRVNNYLPSEQMILLKLSGYCSGGIYSETNFSAGLDIFSEG